MSWSGVLRSCDAAAANSIRLALASSGGGVRSPFGMRRLPEPAHRRDQLRSRMDAELAMQALYVAAHRLERQDQLVGDVVLALPLGQQVQDLPLARGEVAADGPHATPGDGQAAELLDQLRGDPRGERGLAGGHALEQARDVNDVHVLRQVAGG